MAARRKTAETAGMNGDTHTNMSLVVRQDLFNWLKRHKVASDEDIADQYDGQVVMSDQAANSFQNGFASSRLVDAVSKAAGGSGLDLKKIKEQEKAGASKGAQYRVIRQNTWYVPSCFVARRLVGRHG